MPKFNKICNEFPPLIPVIIQDYITGKILMHGWMDEKAYVKTFDEKYVTFFSRSKNRLWTKGETSGNFLEKIEIYEDCDNDSLLITCIQKGEFTCHKGNESCFENNNLFLDDLDLLINHRKNEEQSYVKKLYDEGGINRICKKIGEEATETIIEFINGEKKRIIYEGADLLFHLILGLNNFQYKLNDLIKELYKRRIIKK